MNTLAVVFEQPEQLALRPLALTPPGDGDVVVAVAWSGISTGTERLLWTGRMPPFPGLGYPLVPGYESVGRIVTAGSASGRSVGEWVFVPGARCFGAVRGLFGGAAARLVVPGQRAHPIDAALEERGILLALAATAYHATTGSANCLPELIVGHGVLGRLLARITLGLGGAAPTVWEQNPERAHGALGYAVCAPGTDLRTDYRNVYDVSGDATLLDSLIGRVGTGGEIVLAGFYEQRLSFAFPAAFMKEVRLRVAAEWQTSDMQAVKNLIAAGQLSLDGLVTHRQPVTQAASAYHTAFNDPACLKMVLDWSFCA